MAAGTGCRDGASCAGVSVLQLLCTQLQMFEEAFFFLRAAPQLSTGGAARGQQGLSGASDAAKRSERGSGAGSAKQN